MLALSGAYLGSHGIGDTDTHYAYSDYSHGAGAIAPYARTSVHVADRTSHPTSGSCMDEIAQALCCGVDVDEADRTLAPGDRASPLSALHKLRAIRSFEPTRTASDLEDLSR